MNRPWPRALGLCLLVIVVYGNATSGSFHYDDFHSLVDNPAARPPVDWTTLLTDPRAFSVDADKAMYRPLVLASYALQGPVTAGGRAFHVGNLLLHLACVLLFWQVAARLLPAGGRGPATAWAAAALFAVHPVTSEPVNYVSSRSETLAALFLLAALWLQLRADGDRRWWGLSLPAFVAGLLSKATAAALPLLVGLRGLGGWRRQDSAPAPAAGADAGLAGPMLAGAARWRAAALQAAPYAVLLALHLLLLSRHRLLPDDRLEPVRSWGAQLATQLKAVPYYLHTLGLPVHLSVDPAFAEGSAAQAAVWLGAGLALSLGWLAWRAAGGWRGWLLWPLVTALPASAVPLNVLVNEHRIYLAAAGLCVPLAALLRRAPLPPAAPVLALLVAFAGLTVQRNEVWASERSLWTAAVAAAPASARARVHLGNALRAEGDAAGARAAFARAVELQPDNLAARVNLANLDYERALAALAGAAAAPDAAARGLTQAAAQYEAVLRVDPDHREALTNLGNLRRQQGDAAAAARLYRRAIQAHPQHPDAVANLADLRLATGQATDAVPWLERLVELEPDIADGHRRLGDARALSGDLPGASAAYESACGLDPRDGGACYNGAEVLRARGDAAAAAGDAAGARRLWAQALAGYRHVLATQGDYRQARPRAAAMASRLSESSSGAEEGGRR